MSSLISDRHPLSRPYNTTAITRHHIQDFLLTQVHLAQDCLSCVNLLQNKLASLDSSLY